MESVMLKKISAGVMTLAAVGFTGQAFALATPESFAVTVNINVAEEVSVWSDDTSITLNMNGADANNSATAASSIKYINNVDAKLDVTVTGTLPAPIVPGGGINFFVFDNVTPAGAVAAITANAYNPAGALAWNSGNLGSTQQLDNSVGVNTSAVTRPITYAAASPGELPLPNSYSLTVTYTITDLP